MISAIYLADMAGHRRSRVSSAVVERQMGIVGDRNYGLANWPGQNVTFIEIEEIDRYNAHYNQNVPEWKFGRNVVTRGVRLNDLVGKSFAIGTARFSGVELCEPCATLGGYLSNESLSSREIVRALTHRAGLRADVIEGGTIREGMELTIDSDR
jgi:MOSC domain-containing protein YiiM